MKNKFKRILLKPFDLLYKINPEFETKILYRLKMKEKLNLENPRTFNEKIQWLKLNYRDPLIPKCVDKFTVREYVRNKGLDSILNKIIWSGYDPDDIPFEELPTKFVIKVTHGQGFNIICKNKTQLNYDSTKKQLKKWLNTDFFPSYGEWFYGIEKPRIIIEELLERKDGSIPEDYKVLCFSGRPKYIIVDTDRYNTHKRNIYDLDWNLMEGYQISFPNDNKIEKPSNLEELLECAQILSDGFPHVRVDFYIIDNEIRFGEMTFTNGAGFGTIKPHEFNMELGSYIKLPKL